MLHFIHCLQNLRFIKMVGKITDVLLSQTSNNDRNIALEGLIISSNQKGNDKTHIKNNEKTLPDELASFTLIFVSAIDNTRNIKCKYRDIKEIYRYVSRTEATTNEGRNFIDLLQWSLLTKKLIFNKPTVQGLDSYFIINVKENSEIINSIIANENINSDSNITSDINDSSSKYFR